jgi:hypothetical protein
VSPSRNTFRDVEPAADAAAARIDDAPMLIDDAYVEEPNR